MEMSKKYWMPFRTVVDLGFQREGWWPLPQSLGQKPIFWQDSFWKLHENERNWIERKVSLASPWIRQCRRLAMSQCFVWKNCSHLKWHCKNVNTRTIEHPQRARILKPDCCLQLHKSHSSFWARNWTGISSFSGFSLYSRRHLCDPKWTTGLRFIGFVAD